MLAIPLPIDLYKNIFFYFYKFILFFKKKRFVYRAFNFLFISKFRHKRFIFPKSFLSKKKKKIRMFFPKLNNSLTFQEDILFLKKRFGGLKIFFQKKTYYFYKLNYFINYKRRKLKPRKKSLYLIKRIIFSKKNLIKIRANFTNFIKNNKFKWRQKRQTPLISRYTKFLKKSPVPLTLVNVLKGLKLFLSYKDIVYYIKMQGIKINLINFAHQNLTLNSGDIIQFNIKSELNLYMLKRNKIFRKYLRKIKPRLFKLHRSNKDPHKMSTKLYPKWVLKFILFKEKRLKFIEIDFSTLTFIVVYLPKNFFFFNDSFIPTSLYIYRLYNWNFLT